MDDDVESSNLQDETKDNTNDQSNVQSKDETKDETKSVTKSETTAGNDGLVEHYSLLEAQINRVLNIVIVCGMCIIVAIFLYVVRTVLLLFTDTKKA